MSPTLALAVDLMARPTVSPEDGGCQDVLSARLAAIGFHVERMNFGPVANLWARRGGPGPRLCFAGHTDVVPPGPREQWSTDPWRPEIRDGVLFGRGSADMKTGLAAMVTACEAFVAARPGHSGEIAFLITSDEEGPSVDGTVRVVDELRRRGERIDYCMVGEPSSESVFGDTLKVGRRGSLSGRLTVRGKQGHVAYPRRAANPVHLFAPALAELAGRRWDDGSEHFEPTSFQVSNISGGTGAPNVIPGELSVRFNLRWCPAQTVEGLQATIKKILDAHGLDYSLSWFVSGLPFYTPPGPFVAAVAASVEAVTGRSPVLSTGGGTSDGRFIAPLGAQVVELGVTNATIHQVDECVKVEEIEQLHACYVDLLKRVLN